MAKNKLVSTIIPTYNCAQYITEAIQSVLKQTYRNFEIIVVNDGSTDNTREILNQYIKKSLIRYTYQENSGPAAARNSGIKAARGEYIAFLDADDALEAHSVEDRLYAFQRYPQLGLVFTDNRKVFLEDDKQKVYRKNDLMESNFLERIPNSCIKAKDNDIYIFHKKIFYELLLYCFIWTGTAMVPRHVLDRVGFFNENLRIAEDHDLWLRIARRYEIAFRAVNTATYFFHSNNLTKDVLLYYSSSINVRGKYLHPKYALPRIYLRRLKKQIAKYFFAIGYYYFGIEMYRQAGNAFVHAIKYNPLRFKNLLYFILSMLPANAVRMLKIYKHRIKG